MSAMVDEAADTKARSFRPGPQRLPGEVPCLAVVSGDSRGRVVPLPTGACHIGRGPSAHLQLLDDGVSREHVAVDLSSDGIVTVTDAGSTNGTFVNGARIERTVLREGDRVDVGPNVTLRFGYRTREELGVRDAPKQTQKSSALSVRELEVARAAAQGLKNAEIGEQLHISPGTVKTHLRNIYDRLGLHSRVALSRWLIEHGLDRPENG